VTVGTDVRQLQIVGPGGVVGNAEFLTHITVNANGTTAVDIFEWPGGSCSGLVG
jgi:hypothetical protein